MIESLEIQIGWKPYKYRKCKKSEKVETLIYWPSHPEGRKVDLFKDSLFSFQNGFHK
jgi:hypothetical protein